MRAVQKSYCTVKFLEEMRKQRKTVPGYKVASRIIEELSDVYIDASNEVREYLIKNDQYFKMLFKRENKSLKSAVGWKSTVQFDSIKDDVFFIHPEYIPGYNEVQEKFGCLIISSDEADLRRLVQLNDRRGYVCIVPKDDRISQLDSAYQDSWSQALSTCKITPLNSLIISDNYLFSEKFPKRKESGLFALLKCLIPSQLETDFHLAIFSHVGKNLFKREQAESLITEIRDLFPDIEMKISVVVHTKKSTTHDREILSNYHRVTSGAGFSLIEVDGIKEVARGTIEPVFHSLSTTDRNHMITKHFHFQTIEWLKEIYFGRTGMSADTTYIVGDKEHRLLD